MKVYVVKEIKTWRYLTETLDLINDLRQADLFLTYEIAKHYCPSGCEVVEVQLIETKDLADYTKQVRKEVCEEIRQNAISHNNSEVDMYYITPQQLYEIEQGETK